jgi:hypothetical protein
MTLVRPAVRVFPERPRTIKGIDRIEAILVRDEVRREAAIYTNVFSRIYRRDFNVTSTRLFFVCKKPRTVSTVRELLLKLEEDATVLENLARPFEMPDLPVLIKSPTRIISDECLRLFDTLHAADRALHKLQHSPNPRMANDEIEAFVASYKAMRAWVFAVDTRSYARLYEKNEGSRMPVPTGD